MPPICRKREVRVEGQLQPDGKTFSALVNFWRSAENLSVNPIAPSYYGGAAIDQWAVSQAAPLRRVHIRGALFLFPHQGGFSSGGFLADSLVGGGGPSGLDGLVVNASQQQLGERTGGRFVDPDYQLLHRPAD